MIRIVKEGTTRRFTYTCDYCGQPANPSKDSRYIYKRSGVLHDTCFLECQNRKKVQLQLSIVKHQLRFIFKVMKEHNERYIPNF